MEVEFDSEPERFRCEGCGEEIPAFLDGCPYCDDADEEGDTLPCPSCGAEIQATSEQCPVCKDWVTMRLGGRRGNARRQLLVTLAVLAALVVALAVVRGL